MTVAIDSQREDSFTLGVGQLLAKCKMPAETRMGPAQKVRLTGGANSMASTLCRARSQPPVCDHLPPGNLQWTVRTLCCLPLPLRT